jgi:hypothetical protein
MEIGIFKGKCDDAAAEKKKERVLQICRGYAV